MTDRSTSTEPHAGAPFGAMLRGALLPSLVAGVLTVVALVVVRGGDALAGALIGLVVSVGFFGSAMAVYLGQVIALLLVILAFKDAAWVDGPALGIVALVVTIVWQGFAMRALRTARVPVYDPPAADDAAR